jgi:predicted acyltransferase
MIIVNSLYSHDESYHQLTHAEWNGWTFADTIFPCFLFIAGVSLVLSTSARLARGQDRASLLRHALRRTILIFALGVLIDYLRIPTHAFPFIGFQDHLQLSGVLQKIAVCYLVAFLIYLWTGPAGVIIGVVGLNLLYLSLVYLYPVPGCGPGGLTVTCNFPGYIDKIVIDGFRWNNPAFDPDGVGAILPAVSSVLFGVLAGEFLQREHRAQYQPLGLLGGGILLIAAGELLSIWIPFNKQLWTTSFAVFMAGLAAVGLACTMWLIHQQPSYRWYKPLEIFGLNSIAAYLISRPTANFLRVHIAGESLYDNVLTRLVNPPLASSLFALVVVTAVYITVWLMYRRGWRLSP